MEIVFIGFDGGSCSSLSQPVEILNLGIQKALAAGVIKKAPTVHVTTSDGGPVQRTGFFHVEPTITIKEISNPDIIFLTAIEPDFTQFRDRYQDIIKWITHTAKNGALIAAVCPSQAILAACGLLNDRDAAAHWTQIAEFRDSWPDVRWYPEDTVTADGQVITCCGPNSVVDMALYMVSELFGEAIQQDCARWFQVNLPHVKKSHATRPIERQPVKVTGMQAIQDYLHGSYKEDINFDELAAKHGMSPRSFYRKFKAAFEVTPRIYLQKLRVLAAENLLETTDRTIADICQAVGYSDLIFFRKVFHRETGVTPKDYRSKFGKSI